MPGEHFTDPESLFQRVPAALRHIHQQELVSDAWRLCFEAHQQCSYRRTASDASSSPGQLALR